MPTLEELKNGSYIKNSRGQYLSIDPVDKDYSWVDHVQYATLFDNDDRVYNVLDSEAFKSLVYDETGEFMFILKVSIETLPFHVMPND